MPCSCKNKTAVALDVSHMISPDEQCLLCAEKHLSTAMQLASEFGYVPVNRQKIIGELVLFQWHVWKTAYNLAEKARDLRHMIHARNEAKITSQWTEIIEQLETLIKDESK